MKKTIAVMLSLIFVFAVASLSTAAEKKAASAKKEAGSHVTGDVTAVDANAMTLTVKSKMGDVVISVNADTHIMSGKDKKTLADIKAGDKVSVRYVEAEGKNTAKSIDINAAEMGKKEAAPKKTAGY